MVASRMVWLVSVSLAVAAGCGSGNGGDPDAGAANADALDASALPDAADFVGSHPRIDASELQRRLAAPNPPLVVDVRAPSEWSAGHIPHSRNEPLPQLRELARSLPRDRELVVQCLGGYRSSIACSILEQHGFTRLVDLEGGWRAWENSGGAAHR